jgi:hypothetical protein
MPKVGQVGCAALVTRGATAMTARAVTASDSPPPGYSPLQLRSAYGLDFSAITGGVGQTVAVVTAYDDATAESDMGIYRAEYSLPACTTANGCFEKVNAAGGTSYPPSMPGWSAPTAESLDMISAICPNCHILLVEADTTAIPTTTDPDALGHAENEAVLLGAKFIVTTVFTSESTYASGEPALDSEFFDHPGVAITAPDGAGGYSGPWYPAASPDVIAVGGTTLTAAPGTARGWTEAAWPGTGSGCSAYEAKPAWQTDTGCTDRMLNDLSADADNVNSPVAFYDTVSGGWVTGGGNDVPAAIIAAAYALAGTPAAGTNPASYPYAHTSQINDITTGSTGTCAPAYYCTTGPGYDGPTGLGTPASAAALGPTAPAVSLPAAPVIYDPASGNQEWYATGAANGTEFQKAMYPAGNWTGWLNMSGNIASQPAAIYNPGSGNLEIYARGTNGDIVEKYWAPSTGWHGWNDMGAAGDYAPSASYDPLTGALEVYETGTTGAVFEDAWTPTAGWRGWQSLGGILASTPTVAYDPANGSEQVFAINPSKIAFVDTWTRTAGWSGWQDLGGAMAGTLAPAYDPLNGAMDVFGVGTNGTPYVNSWTQAGGWSGWQSMGGILTGSLAAAYDPASGSMQVFGVNAYGSPFVNSLAQGSNDWSGWQGMGGVYGPNPAAAYNPDSHSMQVFTVGTNGTSWVDSWTQAGGWSGFQNMSGVFSHV